MQSLGQRLKFARERAGMSQSELARGVGVKPQSIQAIESGKAQSTTYVVKMAELLGVSARWLADGVGSPTPTDAHQREERANPESSGVARIDELDIRASAGAGQLVDGERKVGEWQMPTELVKPVTRSSIDRIKILTVVGDSMVPTYLPSEKIMVDTGDKIPSPPGVFVIWDGLGFVVKRLQYIPYSDPPTVRITSDNPKYEPYERILGEAYIQARVIGKWLWT